MNTITHQVEDYTKHLLKYKSLNKKLSSINKMIIPQNDYQIQLLKSAAIVGLNVVFMRSMFKVFKIDDTGDVITLIETASNVITVYNIFKKLNN